MHNQTVHFKLLSLTALSLLCLHTGTAMAQEGKRPSLLITSDPLPSYVTESLYAKRKNLQEITPEDIAGESYYTPAKSLIASKIQGIASNIEDIKSKVVSLSNALNSIQAGTQEKTAQYYAAVATVNTQLQTGTTPGNPRLVARMEKAEDILDSMADTVSRLNGISIDATKLASEGQFILEETRAAYGLSGAIEEDHIQLARLEDSTNATLLAIERILNNVNDDITRSSTYLSSERSNLRTLSLAVQKGNFFGQSLSNRPFSGAKSVGQDVRSDDMGIQAAAPMSHGALVQPKLLAKIRFDSDDVSYEQAVYVAVNEALERYPDARFNLIAIHSTNGNAARIAIESTRARRNAERVLRSMTQMGLDTDRIDLAYDESKDVRANEVHLYVK